MPSYADVLEREAAWLKDPSPDTLPGAPALIGGTDGPFDEVEAYVRRINQKQRQLFLHRNRTVETRTDNQHKRHDHEVTALILWNQPNTARDHHVQERLDDAVDRLLTRIRGTVLDHTHGGRFFEAGESGSVGIVVTYSRAESILTPADGPAASGQSHVVTVTYTLTDLFVG